MSQDLHKAHINGLPPVLNCLLNQLLNTNELKSWSIYENNSGFVNVNIRFSNVTSDNNSDIVIPATYRKVGVKQLERNRNRAAQYNSTHRQTRSQTKLQENLEDIETPRSACNSQFNHDISIDTVHTTPGGDTPIVDQSGTCTHSEMIMPSILFPVDVMDTNTELVLSSPDVLPVHSVHTTPEHVVRSSILPVDIPHTAPESEFKEQEPFSNDYSSDFPECHELQLALNQFNETLYDFNTVMGKYSDPAAAVAPPD